MIGADSTCTAKSVLKSTTSPSRGLGSVMIVDEQTTIPTIKETVNVDDLIPNKIGLGDTKDGKQLRRERRAAERKIKMFK